MCVSPPQWWKFAYWTRATSTTSWKFSRARLRCRSGSRTIAWNLPGPLCWTIASPASYGWSSWPLTGSRRYCSRKRNRRLSSRTAVLSNVGTPPSSSTAKLSRRPWEKAGTYSSRSPSAYISNIWQWRTSPTPLASSGITSWGNFVFLFVRRSCYHPGQRQEYHLAMSPYFSVPNFLSALPALPELRPTHTLTMYRWKEKCSFLSFLHVAVHFQTRLK